MVRELGAHEGSSPATNRVTAPPEAGTVQTVNPPTLAVNAMVLPSGDQLGSVAAPDPGVLSGRMAPPSGEIR